MRSRKVKWILGICVVLIVYVGVELGLAANNKVGLYATVKRIVAHAPAVEAYGGYELTYMGTVDYGPDYMEKFERGDGPYKDQLMKAKKTPDTPPFIFLNKQGTEYYKYKFPQLPWLF
ncbi:hypothetical protein QCD85_05910 [Paenibacillus sp. PsM32]|uniref:hypothetical protein n=1 Tax=unclassified Paenibacillus TaxID=185978 RepID=UPI002365565A|nr:MULTISPECIES: hypothetical protein [unclassified Paenibacillus]MDN4617624.1 hypothetical protein [Paenibacillus sp. PsM32]WDF52921.1 hypothetical protein PQ460_11050 [Paenibacillus sp. KACC 21273]